jgi:hypothetical protein
MTIRHTRTVLAVGSLLIAAGTLATACGNNASETPSTSTTTTTTTTTTPSAAPPAPTEKSVSPTGGNLFTPGVTAPAAPNVPAGQHPGINGVP